MDENETRVPDPSEVKQAAKVLMSKLGSYGHAVTQDEKYHTLASIEWKAKTRDELKRQWSTLQAAMAQLGID